MERTKKTWEDEMADEVEKVDKEICAKKEEISVLDIVRACGFKTEEIDGAIHCIPDFVSWSEVGVEDKDPTGDHD
jgi:hypothetical protein